MAEGRQDTTEAEKELSLDLDGGGKMELILIPPGTFMMGDDASALEEEKPAHEVTISKPFYLGKHEVTQEQWQAVMDSNPSHFKGPKNPVEKVNWDDCRAFLSKLNEKFGQKGMEFGLPSEAQWEYACRAGSTTRYSFGDDAGGLGNNAWFRGNSRGATHPVGQKKPNAWGLHDMHGNVWEWCADWYGDYSEQSAASDPTGPSSGVLRVLRGGSWSYSDRDSFRCASRGISRPAAHCHYFGFRVAGNLTP